MRALTLVFEAYGIPIKVLIEEDYYARTSNNMSIL